MLSDSRDPGGSDNLFSECEAQDARSASE